MRLHLLRFEIPLNIDELVYEVLETFGFDHLEGTFVNNAKICYCVLTSWMSGEALLRAIP